jgi:AhpD family alkylhydroperoxidase
MTPEMLAKARNNIAAYRERSGLNNVDFRLGEIEHLPVPDASVDAVISNCVINLSPDKPQVWREIARVLKPGGRVAVSDLALLQPLPPAIEQMVEALVGCVAGAVLVSDTHRMAKEAGLGDVVLKPKATYVDGMVDWQDPLYQKIIAHLPAGTRPSDYITSLEVTARKPGLTPVAATPAGVYNEAVGELVALGAAIAANCQPCFKHHHAKAQALGVSEDDMTSAVNTAMAVKKMAERETLELADQMLSSADAKAHEGGCCCSSQSGCC